MNRRCRVLAGVALLVLGFTLPAVAQTGTVQADRVLIGPTEWVPRYLELPATFVVGDGEVKTLPSGTFDYIEVQSGGRLVCDRTATTNVQVMTFLVLPGGTFDCGTVADPIVGQVTITLRDEPFDYSRDPYQWSHGLLNFGTQTRVGADWQKTTFVEVVGDLFAGAMFVPFASAPMGWQAGDAVLIPDMEMGTFPQNDDFRTIHRRESPVTIASLGPAGATLSKPLDFDHLAAKDTDGNVVLKVRIADLTRQHIIIRSENPNGVRGHTANVGQAALWDLRGNSLEELGRTQAVTLDSTTADSSGTITHIGTNQIAKYSDHDHFCLSNTTGARIRAGNVNLLADGSKWGLSVHNTDDTTVMDSVYVGAQGASVVTEDGPEVRNVITGNVFAYSKGNGIFPGESPQAERGCPGCEGFGGWWRGPGQTITRNEAWNNAVGESLFNRAQLPRLIPSTPGGPLDTPMDPKAVPLEFSRNVTIGGVNGTELWNMARFPIQDSIFAHALLKQLWHVNSGSDGGTITRNVTLLGQDGRSTCLDVNVGYTSYADDQGGKYLDCDLAIGSGIVIKFASFVNTTLQGHDAARIVNPNSPESALFDSVTFLSTPALPSTIVYGPAAFAPDVDYGRGFVYQDGSAKFHLRNFKGSGQNYRLLNVNQRRDAPALLATDLFRVAYMNPECGATMGESWDRCGYAYGGEVYAEAEIVHDPLIVNGVLKVDARQALGTPHTVINVPNTLTPLPSGTTQATLALFLTGGAGATAEAWLAVDGGTAQRFPASAFAFPPARIYATVAGFADGTHTVETWRVDGTGTEIAGSRLAFHFDIGSSTCTPVWTVTDTQVTYSDWVVVGDHEERTVTTTTTEADGCGGTRTSTSASTEARSLQNVDTTPPTIDTFTVVRNGKSPNYTVTVSASDASGIAQGTLTVDGSLAATWSGPTFTGTVKTRGTGPHAFVVTATDGAGNLQTASVTK